MVNMPIHHFSFTMVVIAKDPARQRASVARQLHTPPRGMTCIKSSLHPWFTARHFSIHLQNVDATKKTPSVFAETHILLYSPVCRPAAPYLHIGGESVLHVCRCRAVAANDEKCHL